MFFSRSHDILMLGLNFLGVESRSFKVKLCSFQGHMIFAIRMELSGCRN